jgi:hypothetical protein
MNQLLYYLLGLTGVLFTGWWLLKLWQSMQAIANAPKPIPPPQYHIQKVNPSISFWLKGSSLFFVGGLLTFLGFVCTIFFRNPQFLTLIIVGSLFLTCLFFYTYFIVFSGQKTLRTPKKKPEFLQVYTHPDWLFQHPKFALFGFGNIIAGIVSAFIYQDVYFVLLSIYGLVFLLHLWSFSQLNILTITDQHIKLHTGLPVDGILTIPIATISNVHYSQPRLQRLLRIHTVSIVDQTGAKLVLYTRLPHLFWGTLNTDDI